jgi:hypothetical protein
MPSRVTHYAQLDGSLERKLDYAVATYGTAERVVSADGPNAELLCALLGVSRKYFDEDEAQAQCALRRYLLFRYKWSLEASDEELVKAGIELCLPAQKVLV